MSKWGYVYNGKTYFGILLCLVIGLAACGSDSQSDDADSKNNISNTNNGAEENASTGGQNSSNRPPQGDAEISKFSFTIVDDRGNSGTYGDEQPNAALSETSWGAVVVDELLTIEFDLGAGNGMLLLNVLTSSNDQAPGRFAVEHPSSDPTHIIYTNHETGLNVESDGQGGVILENCPTSTSQKIVGKFDNIVLNSPHHENILTVNGSFDVQVVKYTGSGLNCKPIPVPSNNHVNENNASTNSGTNNGGVCVEVVDECAAGKGICCEFLPCLNPCNEECETQPACASGDEAACEQCFAACEQSCGVSTECKNAHTALATCQLDYDCYDALDWDEVLACTHDNCCEELAKVYE